MQNDAYIVDGGNVLSGELTVQGAKNSALPILAASLISGGECVIHNCPDITDVGYAILILEHLGCKVRREKNTVIVNSENVSRCDIPNELMRKMRSSVIFLGAILGRMRSADLTYPGGCELGPRPINLHLQAFSRLGVNVSDEYGHIMCKENRFLGGTISLSFPSVGATENIMLYSAVSLGETTIVNAAKEPEIVDLQNFLNKMGAKISGSGTSVIHIRGVSKLNGCEHDVMPDRIAAATYMCACAGCGGELKLNLVKSEHLYSFISLMEESGCKIFCGKNDMILTPPKRIHAVKNDKNDAVSGLSDRCAGCISFVSYEV